MRNARLSLPLEYGLIALVVLTLIVSIALKDTTAASWLSLPRAAAALMCVIFIPGYLIQGFFFAEHGALEVPQRLALSFVLSLALPPIVVFTLDSVNLPLQLETLLVSLVTLIVIFAIVSLLRRVLTPRDLRFVWTLPSLRIGKVTRSLDTLLWTGVGLGAVGLIAVIVVVTVVPQPNAYWTEFFVLSETGTAADYVSQIAPGDTFQLRLMIHNKEAQPMRYDVTIENGNQTLYALDGIDVAVGETFDRLVDVTPVDFSEQSLILMHLYRSGDTEPYRTLRYWVRIEQE